MKCLFSKIIQFNKTSFIRVDILIHAEKKIKSLKMHLLNTVSEDNPPKYLKNW